MTLGRENSTLTLNLVGFSLGVAQSAPLEMAPRVQMETSRLHMESGPTTSQTRVKASHLLHLGNPRQVAAQTTSTSLSTKTGTLLSLSLLRDTIYRNTLTCWAQTQRSPQARNT